MSEIFVVTSGKGGVGKTTVSAFLGAKLAARGKRTIVCDLDFGLNNLDIVMARKKSCASIFPTRLKGVAAQVSR